MEIGLYTFAELYADPSSGRTISPQQRLADLLEEVELADELGLDIFGVGEHHRPGLRGVRARGRARRRGRAHEASSPDERRVGHQLRRPCARVPGFRHARPALGRARRVHGRARPFIQSFPLFGYDLNDYDALFDEKLRMLLALRESER